VLGFARSWSPTRTYTFEERQINVDRVLDEVADTCLRYKVKKVYTDQREANAIIDYLQRKGLAVTRINMDARSKTGVFQELRARLNMRSLSLYEHPALLQELRRLRSRYSAGSASVVNPRVGGSHGDIACALAMAVQGHHGVNADLHAAFHKSPPLHLGAEFDSPDQLSWTANPNDSRLSRDMSL
jgi:phage terminase large subunit-like protein